MDLRIHIELQRSYFKIFVSPQPQLEENTKNVGRRTRYLDTR